MRTRTLLLICASCFLTGAQAAEHARNVILFLADGTGLPTWNAAALYGYGKPQSLYLQQMPHIALSETSSADDWVTDSAAGMTAIVTGEKTDNEVLSLVSPKHGGARAGRPLKTILEYAEEHGLRTGVLSNSPMWDATPAALYAHCMKRSKTGEITAQILKPRFGDGVDVVIGPGRQEMLRETQSLGVNFSAALKQRGYVFLDRLDALNGINPGARRVVDLWDGEDFDLPAAVDHAIRILSRDSKGFFLMVESDNHSQNIKQNLERAITLDNIVRKTAERFKADTLILVTSDHSFDLRLHPGSHSRDVVPQMRIVGDHTAEEVVVAACGPGSGRVTGFLPNTRLFHVMLSAFGWE